MGSLILLRRKLMVTFEDLIPLISAAQEAVAERRHVDAANLLRQVSEVALSGCSVQLQKEEDLQAYLRS